MSDEAQIDAAIRHFYSGLALAARAGLTGDRKRKRVDVREAVDAFADAVDKARVERCLQAAGFAQVHRDGRTWEAYTKVPGADTGVSTFVRVGERGEWEIGDESGTWSEGHGVDQLSEALQYGDVYRP